MSAKLDRLFRAARAVPPDTARIEFGFETRLLARLRADRALPAPWFAAAWQFVPVFAAIVVAVGVWSWPGSVPVNLEVVLGGSAPVSFLGE